MTENNAELLVETNHINYRLRSTFFYRKLKEYNTLALPNMLADLFSVEQFYSWDERTIWGIGEDAFNYINNNPDFHLFQVFCHPKLLREHPRLAAYYRNIAALSQKAVSYLVKSGLDLKKKETDFDNEFSISETQALLLTKLFNEHITLIVDSSLQSFSKEELYGMLLTSTGAQIDGSWRNAIGEEAEKIVQRLLIKEVVDRNLLAGLIPQKGISIELFDVAKIEEQLGQIDHYRGVLLNNGTSILFSSEPDVSLLNQNGATVCVLEIKGGADPAGALERYGAAKKSFEQVRRISSETKTILVASCITAEVQSRIKRDPQIDFYYNLTDLLKENSQSYNQFIEQIFNFLASTKT